MLVTHGAATHVVDPVVGHACFDELGVEDAAQVHVGPVFGAKVEGIGHGADAGQLGGHVVSDFEAARFDVGAYGGEQVGRLVAVGFCEFAQEPDDFSDDVLFGSAPARVHGGHGAAGAVCDQDRRAVRDAHGASDRGVQGHDGVAPQFEGLIPVEGGRDDVAGGAVHLLKEEDLLRLDVQLPGCSFEVSSHELGIVPHVDGEIQGIEGFGAGAPAPGEEGVGKSMGSELGCAQRSRAIHDGQTLSPWGEAASPPVPPTPLVRVFSGNRATSHFLIPPS